MEIHDIPEAAQLPIPLTTVYSPARQIGVTAVDRLLDLINGGEAGSTRLPVELVVRETT